MQYWRSQFKKLIFQEWFSKGLKNKFGNIAKKKCLAFSPCLKTIFLNKKKYIDFVQKSILIKNRSKANMEKI